MAGNRDGRGGLPVSSLRVFGSAARGEDQRLKSPGRFLPYGVHAPGHGVSQRFWVYTVATRTCLDITEHRGKPLP